MGKWEEGQCIVLIVDMWHPGLSREEIALAYLDRPDVAVLLTCTPRKAG